MDDKPITIGSSFDFWLAIGALLFCAFMAAGAFFFSLLDSCS